MKKRAEFEPSILVRKTMHTMPAMITRHIQTEKYSMMKSTVPSTMMVCSRLGSDCEIIWRRVSMSLV